MSALMLTPSCDEKVIDSSSGVALVRVLRPDDVLHAGREHHELLGERVVEDPAGHDRDVVDAARAAGELDADPDVPRVDAASSSTPGKERPNRDDRDDCKAAQGTPRACRINETSRAIGAEPTPLFSPRLLGAPTASLTTRLDCRPHEPPPLVAVEHPLAAGPRLQPALRAAVAAAEVGAGAAAQEARAHVAAARLAARDRLAVPGVREGGARGGARGAGRGAVSSSRASRARCARASRSATVRS